MLCKQTHAAWQAAEGVASMITLDVTETIDRVGLPMNQTQTPSKSHLKI
jgi:hypothetical protein